MRKFYKDKQLSIIIIPAVILLFCFVGCIIVSFSPAIQENMPGFITAALLGMCFLSAFLFVMFFRRYSDICRSVREYRKLLGSSVEHREEEMLHTALELHDTVIQDLICAGMLCKELRRSREDGPETEKLRSIGGILDSSVKQLRDISCGLRPPEPDRSPDAVFSGYVSDWQEKTGRSAVYTSLGLEAVKLNNTVRLCIYRIIQELLTNIEKHSDATGVKVEVIVSWPDLLLRVSDNGKGFDTDKALEISDGKAHAGLRGITDRIRLCRGTVSIRSLPEKGTVVNISVPLEDRDE